VKGERRSAASDGAEGELLARFERRFELPFEIDSEAVQARLEHGVLELVLPLKKPTRRTLAIR